MFKENFLVFGIKNLADPTKSPAERKAAEAEEGRAFIEKRERMASEELQKPIRNTIETTRNAIGFTFLELPKRAAQKVLGYANDITFAVAAAPANIGRWAMDMLTLPGSVYTLVVSKLNEASFGRISRICKRVRDRIHQTIGSTPSYSTG